MIDLVAQLRAHEIPSFAEGLLHDFSTIFHKWNRRINLSAASNEPELREHIVDSLHVVPHVRATRSIDPRLPTRVLDVGSGGGLPAVIIAICLPDTQVTALEPIHKKHAFLRTAARELRLTNLEACAQRLDQHPRRDYDVASSRATFDLRDWLLLGLNHVRPGGFALGFEAIPRDDLPPGTLRFPYALGDKSRAIVSVQRPLGPDSPHVP
jgi:16S rRNA (guanine527-N7)-methyltransferase